LYVKLFALSDSISRVSRRTHYIIMATASVYSSRSASIMSMSLSICVAHSHTTVPLMR